MDEMNSYISTPEEWDEKVHPDDREFYFGNIKKHFENNTISHASVVSFIENLRK